MALGTGVPAEAAAPSPSGGNPPIGAVAHIGAVPHGITAPRTSTRPRHPQAGTTKALPASRNKVTTRARRVKTTVSSLTHRAKRVKTTRRHKVLAVVALSGSAALLAGSSPQPNGTANPGLGFALTLPAPTSAAPPLQILSPVPTSSPNTPIPSGAIRIAPDDSLQAAVAAAPVGSTFALEAGVHHDNVQPKDNDTFIGEQGAVEDGSTTLDGWQPAGNVWFTTGVAAHGYQSGFCNDATPECVAPEDLYLDGVLLTHVATKSAVGPGRYWIDYSAQVLWVGSDPLGHQAALTTLPAAFSGNASGVTIEDLAVQHYASPAQQGAIEGLAGTGWSLANVTANYNHGLGIMLGPQSSVHICVASFNGEQGLGGAGANITVNGCEIAGNNTDGFASGWQAGGTKFALTTNLLVTRCFVHDNHGAGLWADVDNENSTFTSNLVMDNDSEGIFEEISNRVRISGNTVLGNGKVNSAWVFGAGIEIASSGHAEVDHNYLADNYNSIAGSQQARGSGPNGPRLLTDLYVHDNVIAGGGPTGVAQDVGDNGIFTSRNIRFKDNKYPAGQTFAWDNQNGLSLGQWQSFGWDLPVS